MKNCVSCAQEINAEKLFCGYCGASQPEGGSANAKSSKTKKIVAFSAVGVLLAVAVSVFVFLPRSVPGSIAVPSPSEINAKLDPNPGSGETDVTGQLPEECPIDQLNQFNGGALVFDGGSFENGINCDVYSDGDGDSSYFFLTYTIGDSATFEQNKTYSEGQTVQLGLGETSAYTYVEYGTETDSVFNKTAVLIRGVIVETDFTGDSLRAALEAVPGN